MFKFVNYFKKNKGIFITIVVILTLCASLIVVALNNTYAIETHTIIFNRYEDTEVMVTCETDVNGKLNSDCITQISDICGKWSPNSMHDGTQTNRLNSSEFANIVFTEDKEYYCVAGTSGSYNMGCYVCNDNNSIMHWASSSNATTECPGGYSKSTTIKTEENCKVYACYECSIDTNIMKWYYNGISDDTCPSGYVKNNKLQNDCKTIVPEACYECKDNSNIMTWSNSGQADSNCLSGYVKNNKLQSDCKTIVPEACYVCNDDSNILKWASNGNVDSKCSSGYYESTTIKTKKNCLPIKNPPTGDIAMFLVWLIGLGCCVYSFCFFKKILTNQ